jgi:hypothetical protein
LHFEFSVLRKFAIDSARNCKEKKEKKMQGLFISGGWLWFERWPVRGRRWKEGKEDGEKEKKEEKKKDFMKINMDSFQMT